MRRIVLLSAVAVIMVVMTVATAVGPALAGQARRPAKDYERLPETAVAMLLWAMSRIILRRLAGGARRNVSRRPRKATTRPTAKQCLSAASLTGQRWSSTRP